VVRSSTRRTATSVARLPKKAEGLDMAAKTPTGMAPCHQNEKKHTNMRANKHTHPVPHPVLEKTPRPRLTKSLTMLLANGSVIKPKTPPLPPPKHTHSSPFWPWVSAHVHMCAGGVELKKRSSGIMRSAGRSVSAGFHAKSSALCLARRQRGLHRRSKSLGSIGLRSSEGIRASQLLSCGWWRKEKKKGLLFSMAEGTRRPRKEGQQLKWCAH